MIKVRNASGVTLSVNIVNRELKKTTQVNLQPKGTVVLPKGYEVDPNYYVRYKQALKIIKKD